MSRRLNSLIITILIALLTSTFAHATQRRTALVIGNGNYEQGRLRNPVNDATDISKALKQLGFDVLTLRDANLEEMEGAIDQFNQRLRKGGLGLFYYAGHGIQVRGENYLIPIDARLKREQDVRYKTMPLGQVLGALEDAGNGLNLVLLDACRNNPFTRSWRSSQRGLAVVAAVQGTLIGYATGPGKVAADGKGRNGTYTHYLLKHMATPGLPVELMLKRVRAGVAATTNSEQIPWSQSSLIGDLHLAAAIEQSTPAPLTPVPEPVQVAALEPDKARLTVRATPSDSRIRIMNINPRYQPGIALEPGEYDILVDRSGYRAMRWWVTLRDQDVVVDMALERVSGSELKALNAYKIGIYVSATDTKRLAYAHDLKRSLKSHGVQSRIQIYPKEAPFFTTKVFPPKGFEIRHETPQEDVAAGQLASALKILYPSTSFQQIPVTNLKGPTSKFISIFLGPVERP